MKYENHTFYCLYIKYIYKYTYTYMYISLLGSSGIIANGNPEVEAGTRDYN